MSDLTPLAPLVNLTSLNLSDNSIVDLTPLAGLGNLVFLDLEYNFFLNDWSPVAHVSNVGGRPK